MTVTGSNERRSTPSITLKLTAHHLRHFLALPQQLTEVRHLLQGFRGESAMLPARLFRSSKARLGPWPGGETAVHPASLSASYGWTAAGKPFARPCAAIVGTVGVPWRVAVL